MTILELHAHLHDLREQAKADVWNGEAVSLLAEFLEVTGARTVADLQKENSR